MEVGISGLAQFSQWNLYRTRFLLYRSVLILMVLCLSVLTHAQNDETSPGRSIGKVSTVGNLILVELNKEALGKENLFDLTGRTLRFRPEGLRYRVENIPLQWDPDYGPEVAGIDAKLHQFTFPFSGKKWDMLRLGTTGSISFRDAQDASTHDVYGNRDNGVSIRRFDPLAEAGSQLIKSAPAICVFFKPRMSGIHYARELRDRVLITWELTEPFGNIQDFTWVKTKSLFQAVLHRDGTIEMSYKELAAKDAIVGLYPKLPDASEPRSSEVHLSALTPKDGPFAVVYELFHYLDLPRPQDLSCTVIKALGDRFDFLAYYSDFRIDNQEAGTPSDGPVAGHVKGIGQEEHDLENYCSQGRFQWEFVQPVYAEANQMQERPPADAPVGGDRDITFYARQLAEGTPEHKILPYNYAMSQIGHEMGHRWSAFVSAKVNDERIPLGPVHWDRGLQAPAAFPYQRPTEASIMGGGVWQDNFDGTYTQLDDNYYVPATGYSYLDLYLMGLISAAEVPDFFILRNLVPAGKDVNGHPKFKAERMKVTIQDVIAAEGPRTPDVDHSQREFNTGIVMMVENGKTPSRDLVERANGIREQWIKYWDRTTGHRASMTANPR